MQAEIIELKAEIRILKLALSHRSNDTPNDAVAKFRQGMADFADVASELQQRLKNGITSVEYDRKVGELSDAFARLANPAPDGDRCPDALVTAKKLMEAHVSVRENFLEVRNAERRQESDKIMRREQNSVYSWQIEDEKKSIAMATQELAKIQKWLQRD